MIWTIFLILVILWLLGLVSSYTIWVYPYIAGNSSHRAGGRTLSEATISTNDLHVDYFTSVAI